MTDDIVTGSATLGDLLDEGIRVCDAHNYTLLKVARSDDYDLQQWQDDAAASIKVIKRMGGALRWQDAEIERLWGELSARKAECVIGRRNAKRLDDAAAEIERLRGLLERWQQYTEDMTRVPEWPDLMGLRDDTRAALRGDGGEDE